MGKRKEEKRLKRQMQEQAARRPLPDPLDDLNREQIEPAEAPADEQHESWDSKWELDDRPERRSDYMERDKKNGAE